MLLTTIYPQASFCRLDLGGGEQSRMSKVHNCLLDREPCEIMSEQAQKAGGRIANVLWVDEHPSDWHGTKIDNEVADAAKGVTR